ncbi:hypothetical protein D915_003280 [Fasciola hepatica]|uniref:BAT2 N-terminal domain-containing protein n=1 Tax=Fasciola hepatica TaxID=6192 RepID=A0A4E0RGS5_FASHE|nr:hypothetical protein D915_003280 [Fasciola hepatica]
MQRAVALVLFVSTQFRSPLLSGWSKSHFSSDGTVASISESQCGPSTHRMNSKVSKSEKTKLKFAQSNINHVYRGNTAEPHHKPITYDVDLSSYNVNHIGTFTAVRQYGMQVVGKVQGTRRLPPPAWVPSIKAETGGLDSRVSIVPPGGGGWGAPTESRTTSGTGTVPEVGSTVDPTPLSSMNGSLSREAIGTSFEPAYTRSLGNKSEESTDETSKCGPQNDSPQTDGENKVNSHATAANVNSSTTVGTGTLTQPNAWTSKTQTTVASGGLAANKPFFQRPPPVTSSATTTTSSRTEERKPSSAQAGGGASEIVGEPTGWAAVTEEEPNFDERILFSDEEESQEDSKDTLKSTSSSRITAQNDVASHSNAAARIPPAKQTNHVSESFGQPESASHTETNKTFSSAFGGMSSIYDEAPREKVSDAWSISESSSNFAAYTAPAVSRHPGTLPFGSPAMSTHCGMSTDDDRVLPVGQYMQHSAPSQGINTSTYPDPYFSNPISANRMTGSGGLLNSILPPADADTELQNAQRQARTQEFRSAVERARISRQQRETFSTEGESILQKSVVNLISEPCDSSHTHAAQLSNPSMLLSPGHSVVPPVISGVMPQQLLLPNAYPQSVGQNRSSIAAAAAAATAAAMVCGAGGVPARLSTPRVGPNLVKVPQSQPLSLSSHSAANMVGSWQGPGSLPPNVPTTGFNNPKPPTVPQVLQSALSMATSGTPSAHPNGVFLNPDFFVERLLEILNQQQVVGPQSTPQTSSNRTLLQSTEAVTCNQALEPGRLIPGDRVETPSKGTFGEEQFDDLTELSQQMESVLKTESPVPVQGAIPVTSDQASMTSSIGKQQTQTQQQQQQVKRVPGLMDVKVPTSTSRNLAYLWEHEDYLSGTSGRGGRGRSKIFTAEKSRGGSRGRRAGGRFASDDISILRTNSGDRRSAINPSGSHEDYDKTSSNRPWNSKASRRIFNGSKTESENPLTTSDMQVEPAMGSRSDAKPSYGSEPEEYAERTEAFQDEPITSNRRYELSSGTFEAGNVSRQASGASKQRIKPVHGDAQENEPNGQRRSEYSRQHDRVRRGRGGSGFYYSSSRTFNNEEGSSKHTYSAEQKPYPRATRGGSSTGGSGTFPTRSHRSGTSGVHPESNSRRRNLEEPVETFDHDNRVFHAYGEEYQTQRAQRENRRDREWRSHEPVEEKTFQKSRGHSRTLDVRRISAYRDECHFSDSESRVAESKRSQHRHYPPNQRNRSHDGQRITQKSNSRQNPSGQAQQHVSQLTEAEERPTLPMQMQEKTASYDAPVDDYEDDDLPTVRVPPMDTTFKSARNHYARGHRSATFQRGSGLRRIASNRTSGTQQQQTKRSAGSAMQGSRRYRDIQNRYRDDKDGDGGAAAGGGSGAGRSNISGDGANVYGAGGSSGANGCSDLGDNQNGGGSRNQGSSNDSAQDEGGRPPNTQPQNSGAPKSHNSADAESNENNTTSNSQDASRLQRYISTARGTVGDACDAEEWETATEGSSDPESASSNPTAGGNLTLLLPSHTDGNVTVCADSKRVTTDFCAIQSMANGSLSVHYGDTNVADCASSATSLSSTLVVSSAPNSSIGSAAVGLNQTSGSGRAGCQLYEHGKYPHDRRGSGGGSGGTSAAADGHGVHVSTSGVRDRKVRATNVSASGGRPSGGQGFRRQGFIRSDHVSSSRSTTIASIPPLMSITPKGPFTRASCDFDSMFSSPTRTTNQRESSTDGTKTVASKTIETTSVPQTFPDSSAEDPEDQEFLSDGFTKVVSKSSKKQARRRLQMELSAAAAVVPNAAQKSNARRSDDKKSAVLQPKVPTNDRGSARSERSPHSLTNRQKNQESTSSNTHLHRTKPFPVKPTFMGPPMCLTSGKIQSSAANDDKPMNAGSDQPSADNVASKRHSVSISPPASTTNTQRNSPSSVDIGRTWSKVVGTKAPSAFTAVAKEMALENPSKQQPDSLWCTQREFVEHRTKNSTMTGTATHGIISKSVNVTEPLNPVWSSPSSGDGKEGLQKVARNKTERVNDAISVSSVGASSSATVTTATTTISLANSTTVTNVCKVRPQQQLPSPQVGTSCVLPTVTITSNMASSVARLSPTNNGQEQTSSLGLCGSDLTPMENERLDCNFDVSSQSRNAPRQVDDVSSSSLLSSHPVQTVWSEGLPTPVAGNYFEGRVGSSNYENSFSTNSWPVSDLDPRGPSMQPHYGQLSSDGTFSSPGAPMATDIPVKATHPMALAPRHQSYSVQHYSHNPAATGDAQHFTGIYGNSLNDVNKRPSSNNLTQAPHTAFAPIGGQMYVAPQQPSNQQPQPTGSYGHGWTVPPNAQPNPVPQGITHGPRFRQRVAHLDMSPFSGHPFPTEIANEFTFVPSVTACVPAPPSGGLYSTIQGQTQTSYHGSTRSAMGSSGAAWSLLGSSTGSPALQASGGEYGSGIAPTPVGGASGGGGGGLLPHPVAQGFSNPSAPISSSGSNYMTHPNYVGVIGGGRPNASDLSGTSGRQRSIPQGLYPALNLAQSPSAQSQQQFQLHSPFYPSLSPSHQRVHLQQFPGAQGRNNIHSFVNPQSSLYTATYGPSQNQPTPPPMHSQIGYPNNFSTESSVAPPGTFHSNVQSHSFSNLSLQPPHPHVHGHRSLQSSDAQIVSRSLGAVNNHGSSALVIPGTIGPSNISAYPGYPQPTAPAPLSVSGYPLKPVLPTL